MKRNTVIIWTIAVCIAIVSSCVAGAAILNAVAQPKASTLPTAQMSFTASPTSGVAPLTVRFTNAPINTTATWTWNFGDGVTATGQNPSHTFKLPGAYTISLQVVSASGSKTIARANYIQVSEAEVWKTIIDDQFNTPGVPSHWKVYDGAFSAGISGCPSPSQVQVPGDGYLHLKMQYRTTGACGEGWYVGAMMIAKEYGGVNQAVTVRWRVVPSANPSIVRSTNIIPMRWVDDPNYEWYQGEADYCEGNALTTCHTYLHYAQSNQSSSTFQIIHNYSVDLTQWHTWRIEQVNHQVSVYVDDMTKPVWVYQGNSKTVPGAFMRTVLQQECPVSTGCPSAAYAGEVEDVQIDWITIQNYIGTDASAQAVDSGQITTSSTSHAYHEDALTAQTNATLLASYAAPAADSRRRSIPR